MFLTDNIAEQPGTFALVPQVVDAVRFRSSRRAASPMGAVSPRRSRWARQACRSAAPICAAGIEGDRSGADRAGPGARRFHRHHQCHDRAAGARGRQPRDARGRPISPDAPAFPHAATGLAPLKAAAEKLGKVDFTNLWAGQAVRMGARYARRRADPGAGRQRAGAVEPARRLTVAARKAPLPIRQADFFANGAIL